MKWTDQSLNKPLGEQEGFKLFHREYDDAIQTVYTRLEILVNDFEVRNDYSPIHHIDKRLKTPESIEEKLNRLDCEVSVPSARENIRDIAGLRVICNFIEDVYVVADMLHDLKGKLSIMLLREEADAPSRLYTFIEEGLQK